MPSLLIITIYIVALSIFIMATIRTYLKKQAGKLSEEIASIPSPAAEPDGNNKEKLLHEQTNAFPGIPTDMETIFAGQFITTTEAEKFTRHYSDYCNKARHLLRKLKKFRIAPPAPIAIFLSDFHAIPGLVKAHNEHITQLLLEKHKDFFDHCLAYPLDLQQRRSIISEENNCLVVSSAGSGKTSSIVGKVKYLTQIKGIDPRKILLISYTRKAATELTERINLPGLQGYTFHKLALDLIGQTTGQKPSICDNTDALLVKIYRALSAQSQYKKDVVKYFRDYPSQEADWEQRKNQRQQVLSELKETRLKAQFPDMDGNPIYVKSEQEQKICFLLSSLGVKFKYEEPYEHSVADEMHAQYRPDFSIYFIQNKKNKRIYLEHFGINEHGLVPAWFAKDKGITYEEANQKYNDGIAWKKSVHKKFGTTLLTTSSADFNHPGIRSKLKAILQEAGVPLYEKTDSELYNLILSPGSKQEKTFIRLIATFVALLKSSTKPLEEVLREASAAKDERSLFIIQHIFLPAYERYAAGLQAAGQIDFTDAILQAASICRDSHPVAYDYIIVDEFQDISVDRYRFLQALRETNPPAKLYCVGDDWQSIYRFSGSDMALFNQFPDYFGSTEIHKIETTYRFGEPLVALSSQFIQRNQAQIKKEIRPFNLQTHTELEFRAYERRAYCTEIEKILAGIPLSKSVFLLGRYSFDDYYLSFAYQSAKEGQRFFYTIQGRKIEFLTVHKSKGLEADYVILLQCNKDTYGFPSLVSDDPVLNYVLTQSDKFPYGEERRLFYVAITRAKIKTWVLYDYRFPSVFVDEFLHPEKITEEAYAKHPNANKKWTHQADQFLLTLYNEGKSVKYISRKMGRSQTSIVMRLGKLGCTSEKT